MKIAEYDLLTNEFIVRDATPEEIAAYNKHQAEILPIG